MIKPTLLIGLLISVNLSFGQKSNYISDWLRQLETPEYSEYSLTKDNLISKYSSYDFSSLMTPKRDFYGYIGKDYKRIKIFFTSITKDKSKKVLYNIIGQSVVDNNKCDFTGSISIYQVREYKVLHLGVDDVYKDSCIKAQGLIIGNYIFNENPKQKNAGTFQGVMTVYWYIDKKGKLIYDRIEWFSDSYKNNQYVGTWSSYSNKIDIICNWGEYRIPYSGDLDIGAAEFSPNPKYEKNGWKDLMIK